MLEIRLSARCFPTENAERVSRAMTELFPDVQVSGTDPIIGVANSLGTFGELLKRYRIRDAARSIMRRGMEGNTTSFRLNKQVSAVGKVSFSEESHALGDIDVTIVADDIVSVIDSIAPNTRQGDRR